MRTPGDDLLRLTRTDASNDREGDLTRIRDILHHCLHINGTAPTVLIFPEGTDLSPDGVAKGREFAAAKGLPQLAHLLHPRTAGLVATLRALDADLDAVYDVTLSYRNHPDVAAAADPRPSETSALLRGGANASQARADTATPLILACTKGHIEVAHALCAACPPPAAHRGHRVARVTCP